MTRSGLLQDGLTIRWENSVGVEEARRIHRQSILAEINYCLLGPAGNKRSTYWGMLPEQWVVLQMGAI